MGIKMTNVTFTGNKIGILAEGKNDIDIKDGKFINNEVAGAIFRVAESSDITMSDIEALGNGEYGIKIEDYDGMIEECIRFAKASKDFNEDDLANLQKLLFQLKSNRNDKSAIQKVMTEILNIGKSCIPTIVGALIKYLMGQ